MDYLREGINLRAMGQQDPLVAWQKEGFDMFGAMMEAIDDDYLRYVMHVQLIEEPAAGPDLARASYQAADDPVMDSSGLRRHSGRRDDLDGRCRSDERRTGVRPRWSRRNANRVAATTLRATS